MLKWPFRVLYLGWIVDDLLRHYFKVRLRYTHHRVGVC